MKILALILSLLIYQQSHGQLCKELPLFIQQDTTKAMNYDDMATFFDIIERYFLNNPTENHASGECNVKQRFFYGGKFKYELFYCREKQLCGGMLVRNIDKHQTDTMKFITDFSNLDMKSRADTVISYSDHVNYMLNVNDCFGKFTEFYKNYDHHSYWGLYFDLGYKRFFTAFQEDEPPYTKIDYGMMRSQ